MRRLDERFSLTKKAMRHARYCRLLAQITARQFRQSLRQNLGRALLQMRSEILARRLQPNIVLEEARSGSMRLLSEQRDPVIRYPWKLFCLCDKRTRQRHLTRHF